MFVKINTPYSINLLVKDINDNRITNDTPYATIKNIQTSEYYNGITWQSAPFNILMPHVSNGVYTYTFTPDSVGVFEIISISTAYSITKTESIDVYDSDILTYDWLTGTPFVVSFNGIDENDTVNIKIVRRLDDMFWDGLNWVALERTLNMAHFADGVFQYTFTPDTDGEYSVTAFNTQDESLFIINSTLDGDATSPVPATNSTVRAPDGTDSTIQDSDGNPIQNVKVTVYDSNKEIVGRTYTNSNGEWNLMVKPGLYYFMFEYNGYVSVGIERMVT